MFKTEHTHTHWGEWSKRDREGEWKITPVEQKRHKKQVNGQWRLLTYKERRFN